MDLSDPEKYSYDELLKYKTELLNSAEAQPRQQRPEKPLTKSQRLKRLMKLATIEKALAKIVERYHQH